MADKSETKVDPKPADPQPDAELSQLAAQIAGEELPIITEGKDSVSPKDKPASKGEEPPPEEGGKTPAPKGKAEPEGEGDGEPGEGEEGGEQEEDPLKDLAADPDGALKVLLGHSVLGPLLNKWLDRAGNAQVAAALENARPGIEADAKRSEAERAEDEHFARMSQEEISAEIAGDEDAATAYARYQQRKQAGEAPNAEAITQASQLYSYASRVAAVSSLLEESDLSPEVRETLKPDHFKHLKAEGIREWEKAVFQAVVTHEATERAEKLKDEEWETYKEEHLAEIDGERPAIVSGRREGPSPDLMKTDSGVLLEGALSGKPKKGK